ncbi:hypothetical protein [Marinicella rhabdoformis]|uniref:hypothetical protein n=1 Tax=Marinicella rhabdoformis TaxID=2580566 RepID=UPI0012AED276|nr:hypothetical protein [Marinicella rhabdoformis]
MALINCPSCRTKISTIAEACPNCGFAMKKDGKANPEEIKLFLKRQLRDRMYILRMFSYVAMSITMIGALPMLWDYIKGLEIGEAVVLKEHWGIYVVAIGFFCYLIIRGTMIYVKSEHRKKWKEANNLIN